MNERHLKNSNHASGFSILELLVAMSITLVLLGLVSDLISRSLTARTSETEKADAIGSAQAALNLIAREISNAGFGLTNNGIVIADSGQNKIHIRSNVVNSDSTTNAPGEDILFYYDAATESIARFDAHAANQTGVLVNRISAVNFEYFDYTTSGTMSAAGSTPSTNTARIKITVEVRLNPKVGQAATETVEYSTEVALRNSKYLLRQQ